MENDMFQHELTLTDIANFFEVIEKGSKEDIMAHFGTIMGMTLACGGSTLKTVLYEYTRAAIALSGKDKNPNLIPSGPFHAIKDLINKSKE